MSTDAKNEGRSNTIEIEIEVPVEVAQEDRPAFESAMTEFLFGKDRVRPELHEALIKEGIDIKRLATLSEGEPLSVCPTPGALEFRPTPALAAWGRKHGIGFTQGGRLMIAFNYDAAPKSEGSDARTLRVNLGLPDAIPRDDSEALGDATRALFGDCALSPRAQEYLLAHGVDLVEFSGRYAERLEGGAIPSTTRVSAAAAATLARHGFDTDRIGRIRVDSIRGMRPDLAEMSRIDDPWTKTVWSKTTCC